ncbi:MAG TPA: alpha/beta hydrolase [Ktedonobacterales bacterium]
MQSFTASDGTRIAYDEWGRETGDTGLPPVVLHHGFIANANLNWVGPGVVNALTSAGRRVVALDARGHGASDKPHDASFYGEERMAADLRQLFDILGAPQVDLVGYSMGALVSLVVASQDARVRRLVVGGVGAGAAEAGGVSSRVLSRDAIAAALLAKDPASISDPVGALFRSFAERVGGDREALAASAAAHHVTSIPLAQITAPTLVIAGRQDQLAARPEVLANAIPNARLKLIPGDHLAAVLDPQFAPSIVEFLAARSESSQG